MTVAKGITNGCVPMGAVFAQQKIHDAFMIGPEHLIEFFHGYTYSAHPVACAAGLAMLDIIAKDRLIERAREMSPYFADAVHSLSDLACVADIRSVGMLAAVELHPQGAPGSRGHEVQKRRYDTGLHLKSTGESLILAPPLVAERAHVDEIVGKVRAVLAQV